MLTLPLVSYAIAAQVQTLPETHPLTNAIIAAQTVTKIPTKVSGTAKPNAEEVPFYSQFKDIVSPEWKKVGCGVTSLAMLIDFYKPDTVVVNTLLKQGIAAGAYLQNAGWTYNGLIQLSKKYGLTGSSYDLGKLDAKSAYSQFKEELKNGPVIASVHYKFDPKNPIPHLVVINHIEGDLVYYNDPAAKEGELHISSAAFKSAWKKRYIVVRPVKEKATLAIAV